MADLAQPCGRWRQGGRCRGHGSVTPWLRRLADANPFTTITNAARALYNGRDPGHNLWQAMAWIIGITLVFAALSVRRFTRTASR